MTNYTVTTDAIQDEVLQWEANNRNRESGGSITIGDLVNQIVGNFISERKGHFNQPRERLRRLSDAEKAQIPVPIRTKLGL